MTYQPKPIDTTTIELPFELVRLTEALAENSHDHWALGRIAEGFTFGTLRDDANKKHPCLVPYGELSNSEKEYDRNSAMETLKAVLAAGFKITSD